MKIDNLIELGLKATESPLREQVKTWARHSNEKADVASDLMLALRWLVREAAPDHEFRALSIGSSDEPQFRLLQATCKKGIWLYDADAASLAIVQDRIERQMISGVKLIQGDFTRDFDSDESTQSVREMTFGGARFDIIMLHHALYYCNFERWLCILKNLYTYVLETNGVIHLTLMSADVSEPYTTSWLYSHFTNKFFGHINNQDLRILGDMAEHDKGLRSARCTQRTAPSYFWCNDFYQFMSVIWMIMLYPDGHRYTLEQRREIVEFVIREFWEPKRILKQNQDYLSIYRQHR